MRYDVVIVPRESAGQIEQLGTKRKFWYDDDRYLFKVGREHTGENWAERVCCEIAGLLGLPHASYELAVCEEFFGVSTPSFVPAGARLIHGNELIGRVVLDTETAKRDHRRQLHTPSRVYTLLSSLPVDTPFGWRLPEKLDRIDVFAGYLLLDALVGNQDRHEENWGLILHEGLLYMAPTFDHASSLGRNESDESRIARLQSDERTASMQSYVSRAKSQLYFSQRRLGTFDAFGQFIGMRAKCGNIWISRLNAVSDAELRATLDYVPDDWISHPARDFAFRMLQLNRRSLLRRFGL